jgi:choline-sulfatase
VGESATMPARAAVNPIDVIPTGRMMTRMTSPARPNILFLMADQFRHDHLGVFGRHPVQTPNLDRLARSGRLFTQCTTPSPVCVTARIALATGLYPHRFGALSNHAYLPADAVTHYQLLRDRDYRVGVVGKLDLAKPDPYNGLDGQRPSVFRWGFTHPLECEGKMHAGRGRPAHGPYTRWLEERGLLDAFAEDYARRAQADFALACEDSVLPADAFEDVYIGARAGEWLDRHPRDFPWFLMVSFVGPHDPFDPPREYADRFRDAPVLPAIPADLPGHPGADKVRTRDPALIARTRRQYCASILAIDDAIGGILAALDRRGEADHTWIVFTSDHGEMLGDRGLYTKSVPYEASLRIPLIIAGPGVAPGISDALVELQDLHPTLCDLANAHQGRGTDGMTLLPLLRGETTVHRQEQVAILRGWTCLRTATRKLVDAARAGRGLYDLVADPDERINLADRDPATVGELARRLDRLLFLNGKWDR